jgi:TPR repeat protein
VIVAAFVLWQKFSYSKSEPVLSIPSADTIVAPRQETGKKDIDTPKPKKEVGKEDSKAAEQQPAKPAVASMSEYDLERMAMKGDAEAQCLLGKRWVNKGDSTNVVKGIKYLKQAAHNGSSEAKSALNKVYATLQQSATHGSTTASNILREQR